MNGETTRSLLEPVGVTSLVLVASVAWMYSIDGWPLVRHVIVGTPIGLLFLLTVPPGMYVERRLKSGPDQPPFSTVFVIGSTLFGIVFYAVAYPSIFTLMTVARRTDPNAPLAYRRLAEEYPTYAESLDFPRFVFTEASYGPVIAAGHLCLRR